MADSSLPQDNFSNLSSDEVLQKLQTSAAGLSEHEVLKRQKLYGLNLIAVHKVNIFSLFFRQLTSNPLIIILAAATCISYLLGEHASSYYIFGIILLSILLGLWNE